MTGWRHPKEAKADGTVCELRGGNSLGPYPIPGAFFFHDDGNWYRIEPPTLIVAPIHSWRPAAPEIVRKARVGLDR